MKRMRIGAWSVTLGAALLCAACEDLPDIPRGVCGNALSEPDVGERCDTFAGQGFACGQPGTPFACQFVHDDVHTCPPGYGAGQDGLCREAAGEFPTRIAFLDAHGTQLHVGDFDADGRADLLSTDQLSAEARVTYLGESAREVGRTTVSFAQQTAPLVGAELSGGEGRDIVIPSLAGIQVLRGRVGQRLDAKAYASIDLPPAALPVPVPATAIDDFPVEFGTPYGVTLQGGLLQVDADVALMLADNPVALIAEASLEDIVGVVRLDVDPPLLGLPQETDGEEIVVALAPSRAFSNGRLVILRPDVFAPTQLEITSFGGSRELRAGPFALNDKVAVSTAGIGTRELLTFTVEADLSDATFAAQSLVRPDEMSGGNLDFANPLAATHFFGFTVAVTAGDVRLLGCDLLFSAPCIVAKNQSFAPWTTAVTDPDAAVVVTGSALTTGLSVLKYTGEKFLTPAYLSTSRPVQRVDRGDFDGDGIDDFVALTRSLSAGCDDDSEWLVSWGTVGGFPEAPESFGALPGVADFSIGPMYDQLLQDGVDDLLFTRECDGAVSGGQFTGSANRRLVAPYVVDDLSPFGFLPNLGSVSTVAFPLPTEQGEPPRDDLLFLDAKEGELVLRRLASSSDGELVETAQIPLGIALDEAGQSLALGLARFTSTDFDGDGDRDLAMMLPRVDELTDSEISFLVELWLLRNDDGVLKPADAPAMTSTEPAVIGVFGAEELGVATAVRISASVAHVDLEVGDLDRDGRDDLLWLGGSPESPRDIRLARGAGGGDFVELGVPLDDELVAATMLAGTPSGTLAVATAANVRLCQLHEPSFELSCETLLETSTAAQIEGLVQGDFDADGVLDLAVSRQDGTEIWRQTSAQDGARDDG